jgi:transposase
MRVGDVATELGISKSYAYKIVRRLNEELKNMGYLTISGRISKNYFMEKVCYSGQKNKERK